MSVYFAYDGSVGADWVSHYAIRLAARHPSSSLQLVHVLDNQVSKADLRAAAQQIMQEGQRFGVACELRTCPLRRTVAETLLNVVPTGPDSYLICGTRVRSRSRGLLAGTTSAQWLRSQHCNVLAVRVLQPGLLGLPRNLLLPISGHPRGFRSGLPFLELFQHDVAHLHLLYVQQISRQRFRMLSPESAQRWRRRGEEYCGRIEQEISQRFTWGPKRIDAQVIVSDDVPSEIVVTASKTKSYLIYMGASERNLTERFIYGNPVERVLRDATCDVAIYRGIA